MAACGRAEAVAAARPGPGLLRRTFGEYRRRGVRRAELSVDAGSVTGAPGLYGRAGMRLKTGYAVYHRKLRAGEDILPG